MDTEIRNFAEIERLIRENPNRANALVAKWQEFARQNPEALPTDAEILLGKDIEEVYFYLRDQHEDEQMQEQGEINPNIVPAELVVLPILTLAFRDRPKMIEDDKDYQKLAEKHKRLWLEKNPGKDFNSKEGLDYLHGSLDDDNAPTLKKDAEQAFRNNPKFKKRIERYDREKKKVYKNLDEDPAVIKTRQEIEEHTKSRHAYLKTHEDKKTPEETSALIQKRSWERFVRENPEKTKAYSQTNTDIKRAYEKQEIKKQLAEIEQKTGRQVRYVEKMHRPQGMGAEEATRRLESIPSQPRPIPSESRATIPQAVGRGFQPPGRRVGLGFGRLGTRLVTQVGVGAGRGVVAVAAAIGPIGWIVIGVVAAIIIGTSILIIMLAGGGGLGLGGSPPTFQCVDADGNSILVTDGNACAQNYAAYYSNQTGTTITATCLDKCTDSIRIVCDRNPATNRCDPPPLSCGAPEHFCFNYSVAAPRDANNHSLWRHDCSNLDGYDYGGLLGYTVDSCSMTPIAPTPTPPPGATPTPGAPAGPLAFPGAEGFGAVSVGGRGGKVIEVTTLADAVPAPAGSLRACAEASGPRICVFRVGGTIELSARLEITNPYLTIAGQTAPGGGILIKGLIGIRIVTHDVVIRYLRIRLNGVNVPSPGQNNLAMNTGAYNVTVDHCSFSWTRDETISIWKYEDPLTPDITDITVQRCVIGESVLKTHGMLIGGHKDYGINPPSERYLRVYDISVHHNLFVHNFDRNPRVSAGGTQVINNVVYNWGSHVGVSEAKNLVDFINNYWKPGPMSGSVYYQHESTNPIRIEVYPDPSIYVSGNIVPGTLEDPAADNWPLIVSARTLDNPTRGPLPDSYRRYTPIPQAPFPIAIQSATDAYTSILADAGANARLDCQGNWVPNSDAVDQRVIADVKNGTGWSGQGPASPQAAGGFPVIASGTPCADTDHDGMPDEWESIHGLSATDGSDGSKDADGDGYLNLEEFLNGTAPR